MNMETKDFAIEEMKVAADGDLLTFEGYAATFNNVDSGKDVILPGAFRKSIAEQGEEVMLLWQHNTDEPIGKVRVREDAKGLFTTGTISRIDTGIKAHTLMKDGVIKKMSIGYRASKHSIDAKTGVRSLQEIQLFEVSLVSFPMNPKADITNVKSRPVTIREFEEYLREGGFSQKDATTVALNGFKALTTQGEPDEEVVAHLAAADRLAALLTQFKL